MENLKREDIDGKPSVLAIITSPLTMRYGSVLVARHSLERLAGLFEIDLVCPNGKLECGEALTSLRSMTQVPIRKAGRLRYCWLVFLRIVGIDFPLTGQANAPMMRRAVRKKLALWNYSAILLFDVASSQYVPTAYWKKSIVHLEDPPSIRLQRLAQLPNISVRQKLTAVYLSIRMRAFENKLLPHVNRSLLLSHADMDDLQKQFPNAVFACVPYAVEVAPDNEVLSSEQRIFPMVYSGNMFHPANVDGALFLINDIFPLIQRKHPEVRLWIVGASPDARIRQAAAKYGEAIVVTGEVESVAYYVQRACVSICPVRLKIGVQTKVLEALMHGTPVVTTSMGNSGVGGMSGQHLWVEDEPMAFAKRVCDLLDGKDWSEMSVAGKKFVEDGFTWEKSVSELAKQVRQVAEECVRPL
ncbi:MAG: glycosyltransferase family 4 protein [Methylobacillus sp.]|jgi:glycosyltransferase involved in cell wall biosynthesis|nr:glycosyltransferase family 4 protein [Methylobacillus sp.]